MASSQSRDPPRVSCIGRQALYQGAAREAHLAGLLPADGMIPGLNYGYCGHDITVSRKELRMESVWLSVSRTEILSTFSFLQVWFFFWTRKLTLLSLKVKFLPKVAFPRNIFYVRGTLCHGIESLGEFPGREGQLSWQKEVPAQPGHTDYWHSVEVQSHKEIWWFCSCYSTDRR